MIVHVESVIFLICDVVIDIVVCDIAVFVIGSGCCWIVVGWTGVGMIILVESVVVGIVGVV